MRWIEMIGAANVSRGPKRAGLDGIGVFCGRRIKKGMRLLPPLMADAGVGVAHTEAQSVPNYKKTSWWEELAVGVVTQRLKRLPSRGRPQIAEEIQSQV